MSNSARLRSFGVMIALLAILMMLVGGSALAQDDDSPLEIVGLIEAMTLDTITVNGQVISVARAEITTPLQIGLPVKVEGLMMADGTLAARQVKAPEADDSLRPGEVEIVGLLTGIQGTTMSVSGITIETSQAQVQAGLTTGQIVKVHATFTNGVWMAREVKAFQPGGDDNGNDNDDNDNGNDNDDNGNNNDNTGAFLDDDSLELVGTLNQIGDGFIVVAGQTINTMSAEMKDRLVLGALVKVHLSLVNGEWVAREVEHADDRDDDDDDGAVVIPPNCTPTQPAGWVAYTVRAGDTLSGIAQRSESRVRELAMVNCITDPRLLVAGMTLFVPQEPSAGTDNGNDNLQNDNRDDNGNDNDDDHGNDNDDDRGNDNRGNDNDDDDGNDNRGNDNDDDDDDNDD